MHHFIILWEPSEAAYSKQLKIGDLFINSLGIDENNAHEIFNVSSLSKDSSKTMSDAEKSLKERKDAEIIYSALQMIKKNEGTPHIIYAGDYYHRASDNVLKSIIVKKMKKFRIKKVWLTKLRMQRLFVITETLSESDHREMVQVQIGDRTLRPGQYFSGYFQGSVSNNLETFIETLDEENMDFSRTTYHISKMTDSEKWLLEIKDQEFLQSFYVYCLGKNPDVKKIEMDSSESESKYILSRCSRQTSILTIPLE